MTSARALLERLEGPEREALALALEQGDVAAVRRIVGRHELLAGVPFSSAPVPWHQARRARKRGQRWGVVTVTA